MGSEPGSSRSVSRKTLSGAYSGPSGARFDGPGLLALPESQRILFRNHLPDAGLRVVGGDLLPHDPIVEAARHQGHSIRVPGQLQRERFGRGYGLEQVLHSQQGPLPRPGRRHHQQDRRGLPCTASGQGFRQVEIHLFSFFLSQAVSWTSTRLIFLRWRHGLPFGELSLVASRSPLDDLGLLRRGLDANGEPPSPCQKKAVAARAGKQPPL